VTDELDRESLSLLGELWETPVGRRWVLKAGLASAAAMGVHLYVGRAAAAQSTTTGAARTDLHFAFASLSGVSDLVLVANGTRIPLSAHTPTSRTALRESGGLWQEADLSALTHFAPAVELPADRSVLLSVHGRRGNQAVVVSQMWRVPSSATIALARAADRLTGSFGDVVGPSDRLEALGLRRGELRRPADVALLESVGGTDQAAIALTMCHPNVATIAPTESAVTKSLLAQTPAVETLANRIADMQRAGEDYATFETAVDPNGRPSEIKLGDKTTTFDVFRLNPSDSGLRRAVKSSVSAAVTAVRDTAALGAVIDKPLDQERAASTSTWVQPEGVAPRAKTYTKALTGTGVDIKVKNPGLNFGTYVAVNGDYDHGKVPLKIYNNYVRWVSVYVQYLGKDGKNLSADPNPRGDDTKYAQYLGLLPQVFTVLGIPLWDTNTIDVKLEFPPGSHAARLLLCGLGSGDNNGGGWRQYFPADAYPGKIAPTDEVLVPGLLTGILTIGLTAFALATDFNVAFAWKKVRADVDDALKNPLFKQILFSFVRGSALPFVSAEVAAVKNAAGDADWTADLENVLWRVLKGLGSAIPKVLFSPASGAFFANIAVEIVELETAEKIAEAIPIIGQVLAVIAAIGDAATLAEACGETITSPWVIENEVTVTYDAEVTISRDPRSATFPATARSWRLEALVDGALNTDPVTDSINDGGRLRGEPLKVPVVAPFGGKQIQWSLVLLDAAGRQVGTGVSGKFENDDPTNPAKAVAIEITQLPATITDATVFRRAATTAYDPTAGGYTWSDRVQVTGTVRNKDVQQVTDTVVATLAGVAGLVFKQNDRFYLRGVPLAQDGATIKLGSATKQRYARRPFLLLDPFVERADRGNHVLLEPDETTDAYDVRRVSLDRATGQISWDPSDVSLGTFLLPVSAAALHSSGRVVAINTNSGRLGVLSPVRTPRPQLAAYTAGPGTRVGLLSSPIAVAVTNPGVVLVLEAGEEQLAAFDLNGNPVRYFPPKTAGGERQFTRILASPGTPLDLAVDGADQIYVLYFTGTGSDPADYHIDVYTKTGEVLNTKSAGTNIPKLAIDYWRTIFGANYDALANLGTTTPRIDGVLGVAEPSLSRFDPTDPR
jgi:hypothetical protein